MNREELVIGDTGSQLVSKFNDNFLKCYRGINFFNVEEYGAVHDGITDDTVAIQAAINACHVAGGGEVFLPNGVYIIAGVLQNGIIDDAGHAVDFNSQLYIPGRKYQLDDRHVIRIVGETPPLLFQGSRATGVVNNQGAVLKSTIAGTGVFPSVICAMDWLTSYYYQSYNDVHLENISVEVEAFEDGDGASMCGINLMFSSHAYVNNIHVSISCPVSEMVEPVSHVFGIALGFSLNDFPLAGKISVMGGFYYGAIFGEGVHVQHLHIWGNYIGLMFSANQCACLIDHAIIHHNAWVIAAQQETLYSMLSARAAFKITVLNTEYAIEGDPVWTQMVGEILDNSNLLYGTIDYNTNIVPSTSGHYMIKTAGGKNVLLRNIIKNSHFHWTTEYRPSDPGLGCTGFNTTTNKLETWNGSTWNDCF
jgi:hypothetical protein